jgi:hypothetical protein
VTRGSALGALLPLALGLAACGATPTAAPTTTTTVIGNNLTGLGATTAQWNAHHTVAPGGPIPEGGFEPDTVYGPFIPAPGGGENEWTAVNDADGRVVDWDQALPEGTNELTALDDVLRELPADAKSMSAQTVFSASGSIACLQVNLTSAMLNAALGPKPIGDSGGDIGIELFTTTASGDVTYEVKNIDTATVSIAWNQISNGC